MWCFRRISIGLVSILAAACVNANKDLELTEFESHGAVCASATIQPVTAYRSVNALTTSNPDCGVLPAKGALNGERYRILVTTDLPADTDDIQSLIHLFLVSDLFDIEGIVSAPPTFNRTRQFIREHCGSDKKTDCIQKVIDHYELDYPKLRSWSANYPEPSHLRTLVKQGNETPWEVSGSEETEGSRWIVEQAMNSDDDRPLYILSWGAVTNTATALLHHPEIADRIRIFMVGWSNVNKDQQAYDYIREHFPDVFFVEAEGAMFGVRHPEKSDGYDNYTLCDTIGHTGAMGRYWCESRREYVDQDFVSVYYLMAGDPEDPSSEHWGGRYENTEGNRWRDVSEPQWRMNIPNIGTFNGVKTSSQWRKPRMDHLLEVFNRTVHYGEGEQRGFYEITLMSDSQDYPDYNDFYLTVHWTLPDGSKVSSDGFYDGRNSYKARAYTSQSGVWQWHTESSLESLNNASGEFVVKESELPGKLRKHELDNYQFQYDNGDWFLHVGDTAYRYVNIGESDWKRYLDQADKAGFNKVRTWFNHGRYDVQAVFNDSRTELNIPYWQEIDKRLRYAQAYYPHIQFQVIPYGEDSEEIRRYSDDPLSQQIARTAQARFSALPNVQWCVVNDREIITAGQPENERQVLASSVDLIGQDMANREPWGSLITSHQARWEGYSFVNAEWSDIVTLEDLDQVGGDLIRDYRSQSIDDPVVLEEDRYELYRGPEHPGFFFRRLFWTNLLSGGHATYGGLASYEAADPTDDTKGVIGYFDSRKTSFPLTGANQFRFIHKFFRNTNLTMVGFSPVENLTAEPADAVVAASNGVSTILYVSNANSSDAGTADSSPKAYRFKLHWANEINSKSLSWFNPRNGQWLEKPVIIKPGRNTIVTPGGQDWVGLIQ